MLNDYIAELSAIVDEGKLSYFIRADILFKSYTHTATDILIGDLMNNNGSREYTDMMDEVYNFIEEGIDFIASEIGLTFFDGVTDQDKMLILETFKAAEDFEDSATIVRLFEAENDNYDKLLDVLAFTSGLNISVFDDMIEDMDVDNIVALYAIHAERLEKREQTNATLGTTPELKRIRTFIEKYPNTLITDGIKNGGYRPGLPLKPLLNDNASKLRALEPTDAKQAAIEMIGLLLIGNIPVVHLPEVGRKLSEHLYTSPQFVSEVNTQINLLSGEVANYG